MQQIEIEALLARHHAAFAAHDAVALAEQHLLDGVFESPAAGTVNGRPAIEQVYNYWFHAFPDMTFNWAPPLIDGDRAALFWTLTGTIRGSFFGVAATGTHVEAHGAALYTFADGGIARASHIFDFSSILMKAGVLKARPV